MVRIISGFNDELNQSFILIIAYDIHISQVFYEHYHSLSIFQFIRDELVIPVSPGSLEFTDA